MAIRVDITFDTSINRKNLAAYRVDWVDGADEMPTDHLSQLGPVLNNRVSYRGVFSGQSLATAAVMKFVEAPCMLVRQRAAESQEQVLLLAIASRAPEHLGECQVLGRSNRHGKWLAT